MKGATLQADGGWTESISVLLARQQMGEEAKFGVVVSKASH